MPFLTKLRLEYVDGVDWLLTDELVYQTVLGIKIIVPAGFVTDFASTGRILHRILPAAGDGRNAKYGPSSVVHDWIYRSGAFSRWFADFVFYEAMVSEGVSWWRRWLMWLAVRLFGCFSYKERP